MTTIHDYRGYVFSISALPGETTFLVDFPDIPDIITSGDSLAEAFAHACEALDLHLETLQQLGITMPPPKHRLVLQANGRE